MAKWQYDVQKRARANTAATFRAVVVGYLAWLGWKIANTDGSSMSALAAQIISTAFLVAAIAFGVYAWKRWRSDLEAARQQVNEQEEDQP